MHEFPPQDLYSALSQFDWRGIGIDLFVLVIGSVGMAPLFRAKRTPRLYDPMIVISIVATQTYFLFNRPGLSESAFGVWFPPGIAIAWTIGAVTLKRTCKPFGGNMTELISSLFAFGILTMLCVASLMPVVTRIHSRPRPACYNNLRPVGIALHDYRYVHDHFPLANSGTPSHSWRVELFPYLIDAQKYRDRYDFDSEWNEGANDLLAQQTIKAYKCPQDESPAVGDIYPTTSYVAVTGENTFWPEGEPITPRQITDGLSNTLAVVEACGQNIPWAEPCDVALSETPVGVNLPGKQKHFSDGVVSSYHTDAANVLLADGSVNWISAKIDQEVLRNLLTRNDGNEIGEF